MGKTLRRVNYSHDPFVLDLIWISVYIIPNAKFDGEREVGTICACLIPSLYCSSDTADDDREIECPRLTPLVWNKSM